MKDPNVANAVQNATYGISGGNKELGAQMYQTLGSLTPDPTQLGNEKYYDWVNTNLADRDLLDRTVNEEVTRRITEMRQTGTKEVTTADIEAIKGDVNDLTLWSPMMKLAGIENQSTEEGKFVWGEKGTKFQDAITKQYLKTDMTWREANATEGMRSRLIAAIQNNPDIVPESTKVSEGSSIPNWAVDTAMGKFALESYVPDPSSMTDEEVWNEFPVNSTLSPTRKRDVLRRLKDISEDKMREVLNPDGSIKTLPESGKSTDKLATMLGLEGRDYNPDNFPIFMINGKHYVAETSGADTSAPQQQSETPTTLFSSPTFVETTKTVTSNQPRTIEGYQTGLRKLGEKAREQGGAEAQKMVFGDLGVRQTEADIQYKKSLTAGAYAAANASPGASFQEKELFKQTIGEYDKALNESYNLSKVITDEAQLELWNKRITAMQYRLGDIGKGAFEEITVGKSEHEWWPWASEGTKVMVPIGFQSHALSGGGGSLGKEDLLGNAAAE